MNAGLDKEKLLPMDLMVDGEIEDTIVGLVVVSEEVDSIAGLTEVGNKDGSLEGALLDTREGCVEGLTKKVVVGATVVCVSEVDGQVLRLLVIGW